MHSTTTCLVGAAAALSVCLGRCMNVGALAPIQFPVKKVPYFVYALFQLHNFLKDVGETSSPSVNTGLGARRAGEPHRAFDQIDGYDHNYHPADTCWTEGRPLRPRVCPGQCPICQQITEDLEQHYMLRPPEKRSMRNILTDGV